MSQKTINVAADFSRYPSGRYRTDSRFSGEAFREDLLLPALRGYDTVSIQLDGTLGYGSSFLDEAFGGLIRLNLVSKESANRKILLVSENPILKTEILGYIS